jgi:D-3-phosphoglycerate dehydrogenase
MPPRIAVSMRTFSDTEIEQAAVGGAAQVVGVRLDEGDAEHLAKALEGIESLIVTNDPLGREVIEALPESVRIIVRAGSGLDAIDLPAAAQAGIAVANTPGYATEEVASHAFAMILGCARSLWPGDWNAKNEWDWTAVPVPLRLSESRLGLIGGGRIGREVARMAAPVFGSVVVYDPEAAPSVAAEIEFVDSMQEVLSTSDVVSLHIPLTGDTHHLLNESSMLQIRAGGRIVNASRGGLVDEDALDRLVRQGHIACAALDVLENEPPVREDGLLTNPHVLITPHIAWSSPSCGPRGRSLAALTALEYLQNADIVSGVLVQAGDRGAAQ